MTAETSHSLLFNPHFTGIAERSYLNDYRRRMEARLNTRFAVYHDLWRWSVNQPGEFWLSVADYFEINLRGNFNRNDYPRRMLEGSWFPGSQANFAEPILRRREDRPAIVYVCEDGVRRELNFAELADSVHRFASALRSLGVERGDRIAAYLPNVPEAVIGLLAAAQIGAVWSLCSPDLGAKIVVDRLKQIDPKVLIAGARYRYGGREHDRSSVIAEIASSMPSLQALIAVDDMPAQALADASVHEWKTLLGNAVPDRDIALVDFGHPLWVVYTSGTTGLPKPIVHGHGGIMLELCKLHGLHLDVGPADRFFWYTSTGWIMWNLLVGGLLVGSTIVLYDGNPGYPGPEVLWRLAAEERLTYFGAGAPLLQSAHKAGLTPGSDFDLSALRAVGSTGAPLPEASFEWISREVKSDMPIDSICGGTDVATAIIGPCRILPLYAGEIQCRCLGAAVEAFGEEGRPVVDEVGELVIEKPMPSMPLYFWNDRDNARYRAAYFERFPSVWSQGDWVKFLPHGACIVYGRSDATLNRGGIRLGTSEFYDVVESIDWIDDSLVVDTSELGREGRLVLFVQTRCGVVLDRARTREINTLLTEKLSPRHRADAVIQVEAIPRTLTGKKLEVPVKKIVNGAAVDDVVNRSSVDRHDVLDLIAVQVSEAS